MQDIGINNLRFAIVQRAVEDYYNALKFLRNSKSTKSDKYLQMKRQKEECERFFRSQWYAMLCDIPGEEVMRIVRRKFYNRPIRWDEK